MMRIGRERYEPLIRRYVKELQSRLEQHLLGVALFGSVARNEATEASDIDMLTLLDTTNKEIDQIVTTLDLESVDWEENKLISPAIGSRRIYNICKTEAAISANPLLLLDIVDHGEVLYDSHGRMAQLLDSFREKMRQFGMKKIVFPDGKWAWDLKPDWRPGEVVEIKL